MRTVATILAKCLLAVLAGVVLGMILIYFAQIDLADEIKRDQALSLDQDSAHSENATAQKPAPTMHKNSRASRRGIEKP